jgi:hypothetical protein
MKQNVNKSESITKQKGSVWKLKVEILSPILDRSGNGEIETKLWKIKVILN